MRLSLQHYVCVASWSRYTGPLISDLNGQRSSSNRLLRLWILRLQMGSLSAGQIEGTTLPGAYSPVRLRALIYVQIDHIPTLGSDNFIGAYLDGLKSVIHGYELVKEGYSKVRHQD